jgi:DNA polymerase-3 subunit chi
VSEAPGNGGTPRVDFYLVGSTEPLARLRTACRLVEKARDQGLLSTVRTGSTTEAAQFDELLWTFAELAFIPHAVWPQDATAAIDAPVLVTAGPLPDSHRDVLLNLGLDLPAGFDGYGRILEVIGPGEDERRAGRARWRAYRDAGIEPASHTV